MKQLFDVSGCNSALIFYDLDLFCGVIKRLRTARTKAQARELYYYICHKYRKRMKPVPVLVPPSRHLGDLDHMIGLNKQRHAEYARQAEAKKGPTDHLL